VIAIYQFKALHPVYKNLFKASSNVTIYSQKEKEYEIENISIWVLMVKVKAWIHSRCTQIEEEELL